MRRKTGIGTRLRVLDQDVMCTQSMRLDCRMQLTKLLDGKDALGHKGWLQPVSETEP